MKLVPVRRPLLEYDMRVCSDRHSSPTRPLQWQRGFKPRCVQPRYEQHATRQEQSTTGNRSSIVSDAVCFTCFNNRNPKESVQSLPPGPPTGGDALPPQSPNERASPERLLQSLAWKFTTRSGAHNDTESNGL